MVRTRVTAEMLIPSLYPYPIVCPYRLPIVYKRHKGKGTAKDNGNVKDKRHGCRKVGKHRSLNINYLKELVT